MIIILIALSTDIEVVRLKSWTYLRLMLRFRPIEGAGFDRQHRTGSVAHDLFRDVADQ